MRVIGCLAEGLGLRGTARVFEIDPNTVLQWLAEATEQLNAFSAYFLNELQITQVQLDELYAVLSAVRDGEVSEAEAIERLSRSPHWVWTAIDPKSKLLLSIRVGPRTLAMAQAILRQIGLCRKVAFETICAMVSPADLRCTERENDDGDQFQGSPFSTGYYSDGGAVVCRLSLELPAC